MARDHLLAYVLSGVILLNIVAIVLLHIRVAEREELPVPEQVEAPPIVVREQAPVRTLVLEDATRCPDCFDIDQYVMVLNETIDMRVERLPERYILLFNASRIPAIAFNASLVEYPTMVEDFELVGNIVTIDDGEYAGMWYVLPTQNPPYFSVEENMVRGRVTVTYLTYSECGECFDAHDLRVSLNSSRIAPFAEREVDVATPAGRSLAARYNITNIPTMIMSEEAAEYRNLHPGWDLVGTVERDGTYVLRDLQRLEVVYYNLASNRVMRPNE